MEKHKADGLLVASLWAKDVRTTTNFYRDVIGLELMPHHGARPTFMLGNGVHLVICQGDPGPDRGVLQERWPLLAFKISDLDAVMARLEALDVEIPWGVERGVGSRYIMLRDPAGNLIELAEIGD